MAQTEGRQKLSDQEGPRGADDAQRQRLGERLKEARKYLGLTQEDVAQAIGIQRTALVDVEAGQRRLEAIELANLAKLYGQPVGHFTGEQGVVADLPADVAHLARQASNLSERDREELSRFAEYLRVRAQTEKE